ncbi:uncharacterized protein LOC130332796 [Hyla sarda]|uniref:uncharacterized protein LOC130332796 n=1 Tax=Hyla sarda TaxID=327740 RepID=UPI0024C37FF0|nr:uncharacterized protein LOC130332796 [Hyla sarda]
MTALPGALMGSYEALTNSLYRYHSRSSYPLPLQTVAKVWSLVLSKFPQPLVSPRAPLWGNVHLPHFHGLQVARFWGSHGVRFVVHLLREDQDFLSFAEMKERYGVPGSAFYRYLQLRQAAQAQFGSLTFTPVLSEVEILLGPADLTKPLTQSYALLQTLGPSPFSNAYHKWVADLPDLSERQWKEVEGSCYSPVVSSRDL